MDTSLRTRAAWPEGRPSCSPVLQALILLSVTPENFGFPGFSFVKSAISKSVGSDFCRKAAHYVVVHRFFITQFLMLSLRWENRPEIGINMAERNSAAIQFVFHEQ